MGDIGIFEVDIGYRGTRIGKAIFENARECIKAEYKTRQIRGDIDECTREESLIKVIDCGRGPIYSYRRVDLYITLSGTDLVRRFLLPEYAWMQASSSIGLDGEILRGIFRHACNNGRA